MTPLYVDLDGTLIRTDTSQHAYLLLLRDHPIVAVRAIWTLLRGHRHAAKQMIADVVDIDPAALPYREAVIDYIKQARNEGRRVVLATGSHRKFAEAVANHLGIFDAVFATEKMTNLIGPAKLATIRKDCDEKDFEYLGDSGPDVVIFEAAARAGMVGGRSFKALSNNKVAIHRLAHVHNNTWRDTVRLVRPSRWWKNLLVFLPPVIEGSITRPAVLWETAAAALIFCVVSAGEYVLDDLFSVEDDGRHPKYRHRPLASGAVTILHATMLMTLLLTAGILLSLLVSVNLTYVLLAYLALSIAYVFQLKRIAWLGAVLVGLLYTLRPLGGDLVSGPGVNWWLMGICWVVFAVVAIATGQPRKPATVSQPASLE